MPRFKAANSRYGSNLDWMGIVFVLFLHSTHSWDKSNPLHDQVNIPCFYD